MIVAGDVFQCVLVQSLFSQQIINTLAVRIQTTPANITEQAFVDELTADATGYLNGTGKFRLRLLAMQTDEVTHHNWNVRRVSPNPTQFFTSLLTTNPIGTKTGTCETANLAMSVRRSGIAAGPRNKGRIAIAGIPTTDYAQGLFVQPTVDAGALVGIQLTGPIVLASTILAELGFWAPSFIRIVGGVPVTFPAQFVRCDHSQAKVTVRCQRSRTVGVGA